MSTKQAEKNFSEYFLDKPASEAVKDGAGKDLAEAGQKILEASTLIQGVGEQAASGGIVAASGAETAKSEEAVAKGGIKLADEVEGAFTNAMENIKIDAEDMGGTVKGVFKSMASTLLDSLTSKVSASAGGAGGMLGSLLGSARSLLGFAGGGRIPPGQMAIVGERGAEAIVTDRPATVMNASDSRGTFAGANVTVNMTVNFDLTPSPVVAAMIENAAPKIRDAAVGATINVLGRGG